MQRRREGITLSEAGGKLKSIEADSQGKSVPAESRGLTPKFWPTRGARASDNFRLFCGESREDGGIRYLGKT